MTKSKASPISSVEECIHQKMKCVDSGFKQRGCGRCVFRNYKPEVVDKIKRHLAVLINAK